MPTTEKTLTLVVPVFDAPQLAARACDAVDDLALAAESASFRLVEAIFVDDGSNPPLVLPPATASGVPVTTLRNEPNRGKGFSVRRGSLAAAGGWVLMSDVDLSTPLTEFPLLAAHAHAWMACGSRSNRAGMPLVRRILSRAFALLAHLAGVRGIQDTQCGFKLFNMTMMRPVFEQLAIERFAFDVELVLRTIRAGGTVAEVPVKWHGRRRSSLRVMHDAPRMLFDLVKLMFQRQRP